MAQETAQHAFRLAEQEVHRLDLKYSHYLDDRDLKRIQKLATHPGAFNHPEKRLKLPYKQACPRLGISGTLQLQPSTLQFGLNDDFAVQRFVHRTTIGDLQHPFTLLIAEISFQINTTLEAIDLATA